VSLEGILGRLGTVLSLEPDETELILNVVNHNLTTFSTALLIALLSGRVSSLELEVLVRLLEVLPAVALVENAVDGLDVVGIREDLVTRDDILYRNVG
jgi:hypothetical protein